MACFRRASAPATSENIFEQTARMRLARTGARTGAADRLADLAVHVPDVAAVHVRDLGVLAEMLADLRQHLLFVLDALLAADFLGRCSSM